MADKDLIIHVVEMLVTIIPALTAELWERNSDIKKNADNNAELKEFLLRNEINNANNVLGTAMDINDRGK